MKYGGTFMDNINIGYILDIKNIIIHKVIIYFYIIVINLIINGLAGGLAGCTIVPLINPIDTINVQLLTYSKKYTIKDLTKNIYKRNGIKGFYNGFLLNFLEVGIEYTAYAITFEGIKQFCSQREKIKLSIIYSVLFYCNLFYCNLFYCNLFYCNLFHFIHFIFEPSI